MNDRNSLSLPDRRKLLRPAYVQRALTACWHSVDVDITLPAPERHRLKVVLTHAILSEAKLARQEALRWWARIPVKEREEAELVLGSLEAQPGYGPVLLTKLLNGEDPVAGKGGRPAPGAEPAPPRADTPPTRAKVDPAPVRLPRQSLHDIAERPTTRPGHAPAKTPAPGPSRPMDIVQEGSPGETPEADPAPVQAPTSAPDPGPLQDPGQDRDAGSGRAEVRGPGLPGVRPVGHHVVRPEGAPVEVRQPPRAVPQATQGGGPKGAVPEPEVPYLPHVGAPVGVHDPEPVGEQEGEPVFKVQHATYTNVSDAEWVECPPDERVRFADGIGAISGMTTLDLDRFKWDGKKEIPNPTWDFPEPPTSDSVLMWAYEKLEKRWPNLKDRFLIRKMRWRVSPSGKGVHVGLHVVVRRTPKARTYSELDPINVFEVRRALGDDPKRWEYDLRRARGDPGSVHGWLADGNRRGTGGGNYEWQTAGPWQKVV